MIDLFGEVASLSFKLQTKTLILPTAILSIDTCINTIKSMKEQPIASGALKQFQLCVEEQNDTTLIFQGIELQGGSAAGLFGSNVTLKQAIVKTIDVTVKELRARFDNLLGKNEDEQAKQAVSCFKVFHHDTWPRSSRELLEFGIQEVDMLRQ